MQTIFILTDIKTHRQRFYTTLTALCEDNDADQIGCSKYTLDRIDFGIDVYENERCRIETVNLKKKSDILKEKQQFL